MDLELGGKVVLISGGSRGIGAGVAEAFVREGARVAIMGRTSQPLDSMKQLLGMSCSTYVGDAVEPCSAAMTVAAVEKEHGSIDVLVTCVGSGASVPPGCETRDEWQRVFGINLLSATNMVEATIPMLRRSAPASIVCISSICGVESLGAPVTYSAAKAALIMAVKGWSRAFSRIGVRINAVSPGNVFVQDGTWDRKLRNDPKAVEAMLATEVPIGRFGTPAEIASAVLFLASPRASFITGANLVADGGQTQSP